MYDHHQLKQLHKLKRQGGPGQSITPEEAKLLMPSPSSLVHSGIGTSSDLPSAATQITSTEQMMKIFEKADKEAARNPGLYPKKLRDRISSTAPSSSSTSSGQKSQDPTIGRDGKKLTGFELFRERSRLAEREALRKTAAPLHDAFRSVAQVQQDLNAPPADSGAGAGGEGGDAASGSSRRKFANAADEIANMLGSRRPGGVAPPPPPVAGGSGLDGDADEDIPVQHRKGRRGPALPNGGKLPDFNSYGGVSPYYANKLKKSQGGRSKR